MAIQHLLSRHTVAKPIDVDQTVLCSPHELIAIVTYSQDVVVYRLNGQVAFTIKNSQDEDDIAAGEEPLRVSRMSWSPDGRRIAIAWSDGNWRVHEAERGEAIFQGSVRSTAQPSSETTIVGMTWEQYGEDDVKNKTGAVDTDLPRAVSLLDITTVLPRLSALPSHGLRSNAESTKFSNQVATDSVFVADQRLLSPDRIEVLLLFTSDGKVHIILNGAAHTGTAQYNLGSKRILHTSASSSAYLLDSSQCTALQRLDIPVRELSSPTLHSTSLAATQMNALVQYLRRTVDCTCHDFATGTAQPSRFTKNLSMTLEDNLASNSTLSSSLLQLAMTGQFHADLLEWLVDIVKDTGLKRWDASLTTMYGSIQTHLHEHFLPALERLTIAATRLRGLARLHQGSEAFAPDESIFMAILQAVDLARVKAVQTIEVCVTESARWHMFAKWLKVQIEVGLAGPNTKEAIETEEREILGIDFSVVIQYIRTVFPTGSALKQHIDDRDDIRSSVKIISNAVASALAAITAWQGRLFTSSTIRPLSTSHDDVLDVQIVDQPAGQTIKLLCSNGSALYTDDSVWSSGTSSTPETQLQHLTTDTHLAGFYDGAEHLVALVPSAQESGKFDLLSTRIADQRTIVKPVFETGVTSGVEKVQVGGRKGKEYLVVFATGGKSWAVHDLKAALKGASAL